MTKLGQAEHRLQQKLERQAKPVVDMTIQNQKRHRRSNPHEIIFGCNFFSQSVAYNAWSDKQKNGNLKCSFLHLHPMLSTSLLLFAFDYHILTLFWLLANQNIHENMYSHFYSTSCHSYPIRHNLGRRKIVKILWWRRILGMLSQKMVLKRLLKHTTGSR